MARAGYLPPALQGNKLRQKLGEMFNTCQINDKAHMIFTDEEGRVASEILIEHTPDLLDQLLESYVMWWRLMMLFPRMRIVAPSPVFMVSYAHYSLGKEVYFHDLHRYLDKGGIYHLRWLGPRDVDGLIHTTAAYRQTYGEPTNPWMDMFRIVDTANVTAFRN